MASTSRLLAFLFLFCFLQVALGDTLTVGETDNSWWDNLAENDVRITVWDAKLRLMGENCYLYYSFDELPSGFGSTDNTVYDLTSWEHNGTAYGAPIPTSESQFGQALEFDGVDDYIKLDSLVNDEFTVVVWMKTGSSLPDEAHVVSTGAGSGMVSWGIDLRETTFFVYLDDDGSWGPDVSITLTDSPQTNTWYFVAFTYSKSAGVFKAWLNGESVGEVNWSGSLWKAENLGIGADPRGYYFCPCIIDEVMIFNRALTEREILHIYHRSAPPEVKGDDFRRGVWRSKWFTDLGEVTVESISIEVSLGCGENITCIVTVNDTPDWDGTEENTEIQVTGSGTYSVEALGYFAVTLVLETDNTAHTPKVLQFEVTAYPCFRITKVSPDNLLLDRDSDWAQVSHGALVTVDVEIRFPDENADNIADNARLTVYDATGGEVGVLQPSHIQVLQENIKRFTFLLDTFEFSLSDSQLGAFDLLAEAWETGGHTHSLENEQALRVVDLDCTFQQENLPGHKHRIIGTAFFLGWDSTPQLAEAYVVDADLGELQAQVSGENLECTYRPKYLGENQLWAKLRTQSLDGISDSWTFAFPNLKPEIRGISSSESLVDVKKDWADVTTQTVVTLDLGDPDNDRLEAWIYIRDNADVQVFSSEVENSGGVFSLIYDPDDSLQNLGTFDAYVRCRDNYGLENQSDWQELLVVDDLRGYVTFSSERPFCSWPLTVTLHVSRLSGLSVGDWENQILIDENHGTMQLDSCEITYVLDSVVPGENVWLRARVLADGLDTQFDNWYLTNDNLLYEVELRWENDQSLLEPPAYENFILRFAWSEGDQENSIAENPENFVVRTQGRALDWIVVENAGWWRTRVPKLYGGKILFLVPEEPPAKFTFMIEDHTGQYSPPENPEAVIAFALPEQVYVNEDYWDVTLKSVAWLAPGKQYRVYLRDGEETYWGIFRATDNDAVQVIKVYPSMFVPEITWISDVIKVDAERDNATGDIVFSFLDLSGKSENVVLRIVDYENGQVLVEDFAEYTQNWTRATDAENDRAYKVLVEGRNSELGTWQVTLFVPALETETKEVSGALPASLPLPLTAITSLFLVMFFAMAWSSPFAGIAAICSCLAALLLVFVGWLPAGVGAVAGILLVLSIIYKLGSGR